MEVKGANPFLFTDDDYTSPNNVQSNPFLMDEQDDYMGGNDNPFLSQTAAAPAAGGTNPFAFDPMDYGPPEAQAVDITASFQPQTANAFDPMEQNAFIDIPDMMTQNEPINIQNDFFNDSTNTIVPNVIPQKPTDLDLKYTHTVADFPDVNNGINGVKKRPPPPPRPPPSKETQDLFMSAIGEMDATSSHLLDRIPPTRTPSPVSMRDLHSPSPTPEPQFGDLLDVGDNNKIDDLMSMSQEDTCDINQNQNLPCMTEQQEMMMQPIHPVTPIAEQSTIMQPSRPAPSAAEQPEIMQPTYQVHPFAEQPIMMQTNHPIAEPTEMMQPIGSVPPVIEQPMMTQTSHATPLITDEPVMIQPTRTIPPVAEEPSPKIPPVAEQPVMVQPTRPTPPMRPPRPQPPQKPPPPRFAQPPPIMKTEPVQNAVSPKPPPPIPRSPVRLPPQKDEFMDMFDAQPAAPKSTADIMNLYNKKQETAVDLLSDSYDTSTVITSTEVTEQSISESNSRKSSLPSSENATIQSNTEKTNNFDGVISSPQIQDTFLSPQADTQMDTSDSLSKESVSSATFNPFAAIEETSPTNPSLIPSQEFTLDNLPFQGNTTAPIINNTFEDKNVIATSVYETEMFDTNVTSTTNNIFSTEATNVSSNVYSIDSFITQTNQNLETVNSNSGFNSFNEPDAFDAFSAKFDSANKDENKNGVVDAFCSSGDAWGSDSGFNENSSGFNDNAFGGENKFNAFGAEDKFNAFGAEDKFDSFLAMKEPPVVPQTTPNRINRVGSLDSDEEKDFSVVIRPKADNEGFHGALPVLAPPPIPTMTAFSDASRINPFDQSEYNVPAPAVAQDFSLPLGGEVKRTDSQETPPTPLYDEDVSQPLEPFPRVDFKAEGWEMQLRQPNKKKITGQRFWKKIFVRIVHQPDCILLQLYNQQSDKDPFQELPLQPCYSVSDIGAQQYDNFGKIFTVKLQYIFYKERPGVRPGQVKKAERITNKLSQFAAYAIQGDYQHCKEFGSDLKKLGLPVEHAPQVSQLMKIGSLNYEDLKQFSVSIEEALFKLQAHRDRALHYKMEEVQVTAVDELYVEQDSEGHIERQIARVRLFFLGFLTGMPDIELGINDMRRQGKEVVGRHDIIPVVTEEWIRLEAVEFHNSVQQFEYNDTHIIKFKPPDACYIELLRFRVRPPKNRELPLQLKAQICITGTKVELRADVLVPGFASRKLGQVPCEDVMIKFPIPECWIYMFRVEKHFRYGSVKSAHRRTGKIKGIERILGTVDTLQESLIEVTSGQAKYEHQHRAIVWRCPRLPKEGQGAYTTHNMVCRLSLTSFDQIPDQLAEYCYVEFTMPATQVSHTTVRSVSLQNSDSDEPPEKYVRYLARHEYRVGIEHTAGDGPAAYLAATHVTKPAPIPEEKPKPIPEAESSSDSD